MNSPAYETTGWVLQQDYLSFLALLGWLTAGLLAWGEAAADHGRRALPLKWFAFFAFFLSLDATLDLARMIAPQVWPPQADAILRLIAYGYLLEFARRRPQPGARARFPVWVAPVAVLLAQLALMRWPNATPVPELTLAIAAGLAAAAAVITGVEARSRALLVIPAVMPFLGLGEYLRTENRTIVDGLYGLLVTGEGAAAALNAAVLAWLSSAGLWLHGVLQRRTGLFAGRPESFSPVVAVVLPAVLALTLTAGYYLVNYSADRARTMVERDYLNRVSIAALTVDADVLASSMQRVEPDEGSESIQRIRRQIRAVQTATSDIRRVYLWNVVGGRILLPEMFVAGQTGPGDDVAIVPAGVQALAPSGEAHVLPPVGKGDAAVVVASAPIVHPQTRAHLAWLGIDFTATDWLMSQAVARLRTIALVGLFASLLVFFLAHVMLREQEAELLVGKERAEAADRAKDEFLAVMSHEIRTPMHSVLGYSDLLSRTSLTGAQASYLDTIRSQGRTLLRIVQDILDFSALRKSSYTLKAEAVRLQRIVQGAFDTIRPLAERKNLGFDLTIGEDVPELVRGDGVRIEQILLNLLNNAVKFTDAGGVRLAVTLEQKHSEGGVARHWVLFAISDTGIGIRADDARRLFQPFTRVASEDQIAREGTGLGLAIVKRLCELMGGNITMQSEPGMGTRFFVRLPFVAIEADVDATGAGAAAGADSGGGELIDLGAVLPLKIMVADDNPFVRRLMVEYLQSIGYEAEIATSGVDAAARWREFDLLVLDLRMPVMDGIAAAEKIRRECGHDSEPWIIGVSATLSEAEIERAMKAGMNDFLGKPFFVQSVIEAIQASPLYARRTGDPGGESSIEGDDEATENVGLMSWMPDLTSAGNNEVVQQALAEIPEVLKEIEHALGVGDLPHAAERAHYLKNTVFALRITPMVDPCRGVLERAQAGDLDSARQNFPALNRAFAEWKTAKEKTAGPA